MSNASDKKLDALRALITDTSQPPVHLWHPEHSAEIDMRIARNGDWFYKGSLIQRERMVKLFSSVLRKDEDGHTYLVTPQERLRITVEDAPFTAVLMDVYGSGDSQSLAFTTNLHEKIIASAEHPISIEYSHPGSDPSPYLVVRDKLRALISRSVFMDLAALLVEVNGQHGVYSEGTFMCFPNE